MIWNRSQLQSADFRPKNGKISLFSTLSVTLTALQYENGVKKTWVIMARVWYIMGVSKSCSMDEMTIYEFQHRFRYNEFWKSIQFFMKKKNPYQSRKTCLENLWNTLILEMSLSWNFPARASLSYEGSEPSRAGALQFLSWNRAEIFLSPN